MKIELMKKISDLIDAYRASTTTLNDDIRTVVDRWKDIAAQNKLDPLLLKNSALEDVNEAKANAAKTTVLLNQKLNLIVADVKQRLLPDVVYNRTADHAAKVNNALQFLSYQLDDLTDESVYPILKDFVADIEQMRLFKKVIEKHTEIVDANGVQIFPKTFGRLVESEVSLNTMTEIERISQNLFIHPKTEGQTYHFGNTITVIKTEKGEERNSTPFYIALVEDGYEEIADEAAILKLAKVIDEIAGE